MAAFQFDLHLLPEASVVEMAGEVPAHLAEELACAANLWEGRQPPSGINQYLAAFLQPAPSSSEDVVVWGEEDGNRVDVLYGGREVASIIVRIDAHELDDPFLEGVVGLARECGAIFWAEESEKIIRPDTAVLASAWKGSMAYRIARDPEAFLYLPWWAWR